jgi:hypothetical protein
MQLNSLNVNYSLTAAGPKTYLILSRPSLAGTDGRQKSHLPRSEG